MEIFELKERWNKILASPLSHLSFDGDCEYTGTLFEDEWIRILLIRQSSNPDYIRLELELHTCPFEIRKKNEEAVITMIHTLISYLKYLGNIAKFGFELEIIENSSVWLLYKEIQGVVDKEIFELFPPPEQEAS